MYSAGNHPVSDDQCLSLSNTAQLMEQILYLADPGFFFLQLPIAPLHDG